MALKSKEGYLGSLRRLEIAVTYELAHMADYKELFTTVSHLTGKIINRFTHIQQSQDDLRKKVKMLRVAGQKTASCFQ